jgi:hypothetical protein
MSQTHSALLPVTRRSAQHSSGRSKGRENTRSQKECNKQVCSCYKSRPAANQAP